MVDRTQEPGESKVMNPNISQTCEYYSTNKRWIKPFQCVNYAFLYSPTSISTCSGERLARSRFRMRPAEENTRSYGTEVAGMARYLFASLDTHLNRISLVFHHRRGSWVGEILGSARPRISALLNEFSIRPMFYQTCKWKAQNSMCKSFWKESLWPLL